MGNKPHDGTKKNNFTQQFSPTSYHGSVRSHSHYPPNRFLQRRIQPSVGLDRICSHPRTDIFEACAYSAAIQKVALDQLGEEDLSYMEVVTGALNIGAIRFIVAGAIFAVAGPFIPLIFDGLCYALVLYMSIVFKATEAAQNASTVLALVIAITLPATLLYLPQLVGRIILTRTKVAIRKIRKTRKK